MSHFSFRLCYYPIMKKIIDLFNLLEISRVQPQYGYSIAGGSLRQGNLAEHHYLVTMIGWQLAAYLNDKGANIDVFKVVKFCLVHDVGELFGGDIGMYYAKANPQARTLAKQFEEENQKFLSKYFTDEEEIKSLSKEILDSESDEAHIAKIADYMELVHYKLFNNHLTGKDKDLGTTGLNSKIEKIKDPIAKKEVEEFLKNWFDTMRQYESYLDASTDALGV